MKTHHLIVALPMVLLLAACAEKADGTKTANEEADAKARTEALRKEMKEAPKVFTNRDIFKKNEPAKVVPKTEPAPTKNP